MDQEAKTIDAIGLLELGLCRLKSTLQGLSYTSVNLLGCMTLDVEHLHSTVHRKHSTLSQLQYAQTFGSTVKEDAKRLTSWAAFYHTSKKSWYPTPETTANLFDLPLMSPLPVVTMSNANIQKLHDWAQTYGAAVRQRTNRQQTTMAKHGALPDYMYQRILTPGEKISIPNSSELSPKIVDTYRKKKSEKRDLYSDKNDNAVDVRDEDEDKALSTLNSEEEQEEEEEDMYDSDSETADNDMELQHSEISNIANVLIGTYSRYGRPVHVNDRLLH